MDICLYKHGHRSVCHNYAHFHGLKTLFFSFGIVVHKKENATMYFVNVKNYT